MHQPWDLCAFLHLKKVMYKFNEMSKSKSVMVFTIKRPSRGTVIKETAERWTRRRVGVEISRDSPPHLREVLWKPARRRNPQPQKSSRIGLGTSTLSLSFSDRKWEVERLPQGAVRSNHTAHVNSWGTNCVPSNFQ